MRSFVAITLSALLTVLALALAGNAQAEPFIYPPEDLPIETAPCSCPPITITPILYAVDPSPPPQPTTTRAVVVAGYGEGATECTITLTKEARAFGGSTACNRAVQQTGQASTSGGASATGPLCSGLRTTCTSNGTTTGNFTTLKYRVTLLAPNGQGWVAPPSDCSGAGTDKLDCTFTF